MSIETQYPELKRAIEIIELLRHPEKGCPWDLEQTHQSLLKNLIEESHEFIHAVESSDQAAMCEELGDVLMQILLHSVVAEQAGNFNLEAVAKAMSDKLVFRHPHIFKKNHQDGDLTAEEVLVRWNDLKKEEKRLKGVKEEDSLLPSKLLFYPALMSAEKIGKRTSEINFDWENHSQVMYKVEEEWQELKEELPHQGNFNKARVEEELGDLLFSVVQLGRHLKVDPEAALRRTNMKFTKRFHLMEELIVKDKKNLKDLDLDEKEYYWNKAKNLLKKS